MKPVEGNGFDLAEPLRGCSVGDFELMVLTDLALLKRRHVF